jgi:hypothetical protein
VGDENRERELAEWLLGLVVAAAEKDERPVVGSEQIWNLWFASTSDSAYRRQELSR